MSSKSLHKISLGAICAAALCLVGCLPEDTLLALHYAPDGQSIAAVSEKKGLVLYVPADLSWRTLAAAPVDPAALAWTPDSHSIFYSTAGAGSLDIFQTSLDEITTQITSLPARETYPMLADGMLIYLSTETGLAELTTHSLRLEGYQNSEKVASQSQASAAAWQLLGNPGTPVIAPSVSPDGKRIAFYTVKNLRPRLMMADFETGHVDRLTTETDPFPLILQPVAWSPDSGHIAWVSAPVTAAEIPDRDDDDSLMAGPDDNRTAGQQLYLLDTDSTGGARRLAEFPAGATSPVFMGNKAIVVSTANQLARVDCESGVKTLLPFDLKATLPSAGGINNQLAFVAAGQLVGITTPTLNKASVLSFDLQDKVVLAEEYFRAGSASKSYSIYEELAGSITRTRDPEMTRFIYIANLRRLGRTEQAVEELEKLVHDPGRGQTVPEKYLWRLLGYSYLLEQQDLERAQMAFQHYADLTTGTSERNSAPESALNALQILRECPPATVRLYARAIKARLDGDFSLTANLFGELLNAQPTNGAVRREYINGLDGFDREVYYFSPSQRPFRPSRAQRADYLQRFVDTVTTSSPLQREVRLDLFLLRIEMGNYSRARALLHEALTSATESGRPEGILEVFRNYLETPEPQPWINAAIPEVFLHPTIRPLLEKSIVNPEDRLLMAVVAVKMALLQNDPDAARAEANIAGTEWAKISQQEPSPDLWALYGRLLVFRAREAELRGLYAEAAEGYEQAVKTLETSHAGNFEMQEEIRYRAALLRLFVAEYPDMAASIKSIEAVTGTELINPTWDTAALQTGARQYVQLYDTTTGTLRLWAAYEAGICFGKLQKSELSRAALLEAASDAAPDFLRRKAVLELTAIDETLQDPWNAARWYARIGAMRGISEEMRLWCSYQIARLHISIGYKVAAARDALSVIVSNHPELPLSVQARELLVSTETR